MICKWRKSIAWNCVIFTYCGTPKCNANRSLGPSGPFPAEIAEYWQTKLLQHLSGYCGKSFVPTDKPFTILCSHSHTFGHSRCSPTKTNCDITMWRLLNAPEFGRYSDTTTWQGHLMLKATTRHVEHSLGNRSEGCRQMLLLLRHCCRGSSPCFQALPLSLTSGSFPIFQNMARLNSAITPAVLIIDLEEFPFAVSSVCWLSATSLLKNHERHVLYCWSDSSFHRQPGWAKAPSSPNQSNIHSFSLVFVRPFFVLPFFGVLTSPHTVRPGRRSTTSSRHACIGSSNTTRVSLWTQIVWLTGPAYVPTHRRVPIWGAHLHKESSVGKGQEWCQQNACICQGRNA